jgi:uncharacterized membrane protein YbhN (UPF0104 family)
MMSEQPGAPDSPTANDPRDTLARTGKARVNWLRWLGTLAATALLVYLLSRQDWGEFWLALKGIPAWAFAAAVGLMLLSRLAVIGRWVVLLRSAGVEISLWQSTRLVFAGLFASNFLPTTVGGDVIRLAGAVQLRLDSAVTAASLVMDRLVGMAGMATLLPLGLPQVLSHPGGLQMPPSGTSSLLAGSALAARLKPLWDKALGFVRHLLRAFAIWAKKPGALLLALLWTYGHMACLFTTLWVLFQGMGEPVPWLTVAGLWIFSYFVSLLPVSVNGLGVQEVSIAYLYATFGGASMEAGLALAVLYRLLQLIASLPGVFFLPGLLKRAPQGQEIAP